MAKHYGFCHSSPSFLLFLASSIRCFVGVPGRIFSVEWQQMWRKALGIEDIELQPICGVEKQLNPIFMGQCLVRYGVKVRALSKRKDFSDFFLGVGASLGDKMMMPIISQIKMKFDNEVTVVQFLSDIDSTHRILRWIRSGGLKRLANSATLELCGVNMAIGSSHRPMGIL